MSPRLGRNPLRHEHYTFFKQLTQSSSFQIRGLSQSFSKMDSLNFRLTVGGASMSIDTIHKLSGHSDWHKFHSSLKNYLIFNNLYDVVRLPTGPLAPSTANQTRSTATTSADVSLQYNSRKDLWNLKNDKALTVLRQRCAPNGEKIVEKHENFIAALEALEKRYKPRGHSAFTEAMKRLRRTTLTTCKDIEDFVQQLQEVQNQLSEVKLSFPRPYILTILSRT